MSIALNVETVSPFNTVYLFVFTPTPSPCSFLLYVSLSLLFQITLCLTSSFRCGSFRTSAGPTQSARKALAVALLTTTSRQRLILLSGISIFINRVSRRQNVTANPLKIQSLSQSYVRCGEPSLTRGRVCGLQLLLVLVSAISLESESRGTHDHILRYQNRDSISLEGQIPLFISSRNRVALLYS
jgi:hypothetical protein